MVVGAGKDAARPVSRRGLMKYVRVPGELHTSQVLAEGFCFSPGRYVRFIPPKQKGASHYAPLDKLVVVREDVLKVRKDETYRYAEIGDINVATGAIGFRNLKGYRLPTNRLARAETGDVLISTVRTYRKGIGLVTDDGDNLVTTNAILNFCAATDFAPGVTLPYVYAFLRSDFFVEQVWSQLNRGVYPRMDSDALAKISLPIADDRDVCTYVAALALAIAEKEKAIRMRSDEIYARIEGELARNQAGTFHYEYPMQSEITRLGRFDAAIYSYEYKSKIARIQNYKGGCQTPSVAGFSITPGPSLEIKILLTRLDSETPKPGFYQLLIPANISEYGTMDIVTWLGTARKLPLLRAGDILFGEAGFHKGRSIVLIDEPERATTNAHGLYARRSDGDVRKSIFFRCIFSWYRSQRLIDLMAVGGSGGHFSPDYFDFVLIPEFPESLQREIARLYHNPAPSPARKTTLSNFVAWHQEWNEGLGIWELDREVKALRRALVEVQEKIIEGETVKLPFA
jgi:hypothetical protein